jgi:predicted permease
MGEGARAYAQYSLVTPDLFETLRIPLVAGRGFSPAEPRHVVVISRNLAERAFPGRDPVGRRMTATPWGGDPETFEVIGVVEDVRYADLREPPPEIIYFDSRGWSWTDWEVFIVARAEGVPESLVPRIREELAGLDRSIPLSQVRMMGGYVEDQLAANRFAVTLIGLFSVVAACLALIGLYGVISFTTSQRTREIGIRMALGAARNNILAWVLRRGVALTGAGIALGLLAAWFLTNLAESLLFEVTATDSFSFAVVALSLASLALLASYVPAWRATRIEPMRVLGAESSRV